MLFLLRRRERTLTTPGSDSSSVIRSNEVLGKGGLSEERAISVGDVGGEGKDGGGGGIGSDSISGATDEITVELSVTARDREGLGLTSDATLVHTREGCLGSQKKK